MKKLILLTVSILLISLAYSFAEVPCKVNYQGRLIKDNVPVDGTKTMKFSIYDSAVGPTLLWTSEDVSVTVHNGLFRYVIGSGGTDLSGMDWTAGQALYLEVVIDGETLTPREELSAYPYAINSHLLEGETKEYFLNTSVDTQTKQGNLNIMGNVGIGTNDPKEYLHLHNSGSVSYMLITNGWIGHTQTDGLRIGTTAYGNGLIWLYENAPLRFATNNQDRVRIDETGNVGIGTTSPGEKLTVTGTIESTTGGIKFPDGTLQTTAAEGGVFGSWTDRDSANNTLVKNATYRATSDGFVSVYVTAFTVEVYGYTDSSNPPTTLRFIASAAHAATGNPKGSFTMPVRKGDYWKVTTNTGSPDSIQWLPIGSGTCVRQ